MNLKVKKKKIISMLKQPNVDNRIIKKRVKWVDKTQRNQRIEHKEPN